MTKQEEIREEIFQLLKSPLRVKYAGVDTVEVGLINQANDILQYLHSQGVVIKVKCSDCEWSQFVDEESVGMTPCHSCNSTGYLVEPLIKEGLK